MENFYPIVKVVYKKGGIYYYKNFGIVGLCHLLLCMNMKNKKAVFIRFNPQEKEWVQVFGGGITWYWEPVRLYQFRLAVIPYHKIVGKKDLYE